MEFDMTREQKAIRKAARDFAEGEFPEIASEYDNEEKFPRRLWKKACELGFVGGAIREEYGGMGLTKLEEAIIIEEFCRVDPGIGIAILLPAFGSEIIQKFGSEELKQEYLPKICDGKAIMGTAVTEPDAGSDVASVRTRIEREGDEYIVSGNKIFISNGSIADFLIILGRSFTVDDDVHKGISMILVDTDTEGFKATKMYGKLGIRPSDTAEISMNNIRVPVKNLIGKEGYGFYYLMDFFNESRVWVAAQAVGTAQGAYEKALRYARERKQFGRSIAEFQAIQFKLAEMATKIEAARWLTYRAAWHCAIGKPDPALSSMAKWYAGEVAVRVCDEALQIHGGYGYMEEYDMERFYRNAKITEIYEGTKEVQKLIIAREILRRIR
jgi:alkylation response protein AidB-like acyl-CoA dehydrogenase